ncbi:MAG: hypothetical protein U5N58_13465 [Actinomycetota bacterium]|nr:hypothetical protein [Actinomycetota bacterium]
MLIIISAMFLALVLGMVFDQGVLIFWVGGILAARGIILIVMAIRKTGPKGLKVFLFMADLAGSFTYLHRQGINN